MYSVNLWTMVSNTSNISNLVIQYQGIILELSVEEVSNSKWQQRIVKERVTINDNLELFLYWPLWSNNGYDEKVTKYDLAVFLL